MFGICYNGLAKITPIYFFVSAFLFLATIPLSEQNSTECCPAGTLWTKSKFCSDRSKIRLNCDIYKADPEEDASTNFTINYETKELQFILGGRPISHEHYCTITNETKQIALVCFLDDELENNYPDWRVNILGSIFIISTLSLVVTLIIYLYLPELRDNQDKSMICVMISLAAGYFILAILNIITYGSVFAYICIPTAFALYYSFLTAFSWLNIVSFNIWKTVWFKNFAISEDSLFTVFCIIGWGIPTCFLIAALTTHHIDGSHLKPGFGYTKCWFSDRKAEWVFFRGPLSILLLLNVMYLSLTSWKLWQTQVCNNPCKLRRLKTKCLLYIKLLLVMGVTWIFEITSSIQGWESHIYWLPMDVFNALQGVIIFVLMVATRTKVKILLAKKKPFGIPFPKSWALQIDEESGNVCQEELELSRSS